MLALCTKSRLKHTEGVRFLDRGRNIIPKEGGGSAKGKGQRALPPTIIFEIQGLHFEIRDFLLGRMGLVNPYGILQGFVSLKEVFLNDFDDEIRQV